MATTVTYDGVDAPKITLTREDSGGFTAIIEIEGLAPQRDVTSEERSVGVTSLDPPTVAVGKLSTDYRTHRALIDAAWRAVSASATSTLGDTGGPIGLICTCMRVTSAVRFALRLLDEDV